MAKRLLLCCALILSMSQLFSQSNVLRDRVLLEIFTGTWCPFCPGAALGADDLIHNGQDVAVIEWHWDDVYQTPEAVTRLNQYSVTAFPTQVFDGTNNYGGGDPVVSSYPSYLVHYNSAINVLTPIDLTTSVAFENGQYTVEAIANQVASTPGGATPTLYLVVTESHIQDSWQGMSEVNFAQRTILPSISGTPLNLGVGMQDTVSFTFQPDPEWNLLHTEFVFFIQDPVSKVMFNAGIKPAKMNDVSVNDFASDLNDFRCPSKAFKPEINLKNEGAETLTSLTILYSVNNQNPQLYNWTGTLEYDETEVVEIPAEMFNLNNGVNVVNIELLSPNGKADQVAGNNILDGNWIVFPYESGEFELEIRPDFFGGHITWEVKDPTGAVIESGGPYTHTDTSLILESFDLGADPGCHDFRMYDSGGNGLTSIFPGYFKLKDPDGNPIYESLDGDFGSETGGTFEVTYPTALDELEAGVVSVFPNPTSDRFTVNLSDFAGKQVRMEVYQMNGARLSAIETLEGRHEFDLADHPAGVYLLKVMTEEGHHLQKISKR
ncbi:MAG: T9SS type A sorting domain-containing protein [Bacteroidota bacterium]